MPLSAPLFHPTAFQSDVPPSVSEGFGIPNRSLDLLARRAGRAGKEVQNFCKPRDQVPVCWWVCVSFVWDVGLVWISIKWYGLFHLGLNKFVAGVKMTSVGMKWIVFCINTLSKSIKTLSKVMKSKLVYEKIIAIWKNINGIKIYHSYKNKAQRYKNNV